jgi:uncharacterized membrane protein
MTEPDQAIIARMSSDFAAITAYLARASADLRHLELVVAQRQAQPLPPPAPWSPAAPPPQPPQPAVAAPRSEGWIGKALAIAGVAVTLVGVALLLVLAAQAGILRPGFRVVAGAALAAALVGVGWRLNAKPGGRVGAIALAATGIAAAYIDVIAVTTIYHWVAAPVGLVIAAVVAFGGLLLARRWDAQHLGSLVLVPLIGLGPVVADGFTPLLIGFMLALGAVSVPVALGRDWIGMHAARMAVTTVPLMISLVLATFDTARSPLLAVACAVAGLVAICSALLLLRHTRRTGAMAVLTAVGTLPVLTASLAVDRMVAAPMAASLAVVLLVVVLGGDRLPGMTARARTVWSA